MSAQDLEQMAQEMEARYLLAMEFEADGQRLVADRICAGSADLEFSRPLRAIAAALRQQPAPVVDDVLRELIDAADKAKRAYWLARNSAAGLTNYCPESANSRRCERELDEAERIYRDSGFEAALARAQGVQS